MTWTRFWDMHSGGGLKEPPYNKIYIEAPLEEAKRIFYSRFGHNPDRVTCTCCGPDYTVDEDPTLEQASGYHRNCPNLVTPRDPETGLFKQPEDPWFHENYYVEPGQEEDARAHGYEVQQSGMIEYSFSGGRVISVDEYVQQPEVLVIYASEIKNEERTGDVPDQGYVWVD